jgi:ubiquinone/menaquinone biosynthesis C-methylase UbiE
MQTSAAAGWDRHADTYAKLFAPLTGYIARSMLRMVDSRLPARATILDIACGTGALTLPAVERSLRERAATGSAGLVVATDFSAGMLDYTRAAATAMGADDDLLRCEIQDGEALTYANASFDAVFSSFGIFLFDDRRAGWREAARVLEPGGVFATAVWQGPEHNPMLRLQMEPIMRTLPQRLLPTEHRGWLEVATADALIAELREVTSLTDFRCQPFHASIALPSARATFDAMLDNPLVGALLRQCTPDELEVVRDAVLASFIELSGGDDQPLLFDSACNILIATAR